jgi:hypothetical protein
MTTVTIAARPSQLNERALLEIILEKVIIMASTVETLVAEVAAQTTVVQGAVTLLQSLHDQLVAAGTDQAALTTLATSLQANTDALSAAVVANTPAAAPSPAPAP